MASFTRIELVLGPSSRFLAHLERLGQVLFGLERRDEGVGVVREGLGRSRSRGGIAALLAHL